MKKLLPALAVCLALLSSSATRASDTGAVIESAANEPGSLFEGLELYAECAEGTRVPPVLLRAIARAESDELDHAIGDGGLSLGRFQLYEVYHGLRAAAWGEYDPHDPAQAGRIAARYLDACYGEFGDWLLAVAAYRQGIAGVRRNGPTWWYVDRVMARLE